MTYNEMRDILEVMADNKDIGINGILFGVASVCYEKSNHALEAWQDEDLARRWNNLGKKLDQYRTTVSKLEKDIW